MNWIKQELSELKTRPRDLRKFGLLVGGVLCALGLLMLLRHRGHYPWFLVPGGILLVLGLVAPRSLLWVYKAWMTLAIVLGLIVSTILLTLFFFFVVTPLGLIARASGKDFLTKKLDKTAGTYWAKRGRQAADAASMQKQY